MGKSISRRLEKSQRQGAGCLVVFGLVFATFGSFFVWVFMVRPFVLAQGARDWVATPCRILSSEVTTHHDSEDGDTYGVAVSYEYEWNNALHRGDRYDFARISDGDRGAKQQMVNSMPPGATLTCYVDPDDPAQSVIDREFHLRWSSIWILLFPAAGLGIMFAGTRRFLRDRAASGAAAVRSAPLSPIRKPAGPVRLKASLGREAIGLLVMSLFWNGIVAVFWFALYASGNASVWVVLFLGLFQAIGILLVVLWVRKAMQAFAPVPIITASSNPVSLGGKLSLKMTFSRDPSAVQRLRLTLVGREEATYRRGTDTVTDKQVFFRAVILDESRPARLATAAPEVQVPIDTMHSFAARSNKIVWVVELEEVVLNWPDVKCEYPIEVAPAAMTERTHV